MLTNPRTTVLGYAVLAGCALYLGQHVWAGTLTLDDLKAVIGLAGGLGLIASADGGH
jgi:hypothetical protein